MTIKIIAGDFKRKTLKKISRNIDVRPILARVRKSLFDILKPRLDDCKFLDLFAGSGAVGIEALSRGAKLAVFVDGNRACIHLIKQNLEALGATGRSKVTQTDITQGLDWLRYKALSPFDIIFMGPPYPENLVTKTLKLVGQADILNPDGWIIAQHHKKEQIEPYKFEMFRQKFYGDTVLSFFRRPVPVPDEALTDSPPTSPEDFFGRGEKQAPNEGESNDN